MGGKARQATLKTVQQKIRDLASLDVTEHVKLFGTTEENVKLHIVMPLLELLGQYREV